MAPLTSADAVDGAASLPIRGAVRAGAPADIRPPTESKWHRWYRRWLEPVFDPIANWFDDRCASLSASIAFYSAFSLAPTLVLIIAIISFFYGNDAAQGKLVGEVRGFVGDQAAAGLQAMINSAWQARAAAGTTAISIIVVAVGASATFASLTTAVNDICPTMEATQGARTGIWGLIRIRLVSFGLVIAAGFVMVFMLVIDTIIRFAGDWLIEVHSPAFVMANLAQRAVSLFILLAAFTLLLKLLPDAPIQWRPALLGGLTAALLFTGGKNLFGFYLTHAGTANSFGAAGSLAVVLMWLYYSAAVFLLGAEVTAASARRRGLLAPHPRAIRKALLRTR